MTTLALIGCGKMGSAMMRGWLAAKTAEKIFVIEPSGLPDEFKNNPTVVLTDAAPECDVIILAVKPQMMNDVCANLNPGKALILSIAAGQKIGNFETHFGAAHPIIRAMPNTPAAVGQGITVAVANKNVSTTQRTTADTLLKSIGQVEWIDDEALMDAVTALSGSGPAYVFYLIEVLAKAGEQSGLPADFAMILARQTVIGSAALAANDPGTATDALRKNVTSPGGTTEAALKVLMDGRMQDLFTQALAAATARSKELSK
jgi:pyrroline-5-carboxylate reductase